MQLGDLLFLALALTVLAGLTRAAYACSRKRWRQAGHTVLALSGLLVVYVTALVGSSLLRPRREYTAGVRRCFDDWCIAVSTVESGGPCPFAQGLQTWTAHVQVSSVARRIRQSARDADVEIEDREGARYQPCAAPRGRPLTDFLDPGESFESEVPFQMPAGRVPAGLVVHHGTFPGVLIIGADASILHTPALHRVEVRR